ncbi:tail fiber protein [Shewanella sp. AS16]|uniref:phage tail protein n=1 Tax=Shewanella sp. AS16 TaxID=2907625 RepID=UPI001F1B536C|nr:tail fiber protein [Shewanella sp. AS16]MCE9685548.1 tail fiber protein [Shewanella sp. AS16]
MSQAFIGEIRIYPYAYSPRNWTHCDGQLLSISQNQALFAIMGTTYGGDGRTTLATPNLQGRAPLHAGIGPGLPPHVLGERGGQATVELDESEMASHNHDIKGAKGSGSTNVASSTTYLGQQKPTALVYKKDYQSGQSLSALNSGTIASSGASLPHENRQPFLAIPFCLCLDGMFPSRN